MKKITALLLALMMLAGVLAGCGKPQDTGKAGKLKVVTTIFPAYDWVRAILGDKADNAEVTMLLDNGVDLHSYQPTADDIVKISDCDLFVYVGGESDGWVENALKNAANRNMKVINLLEVLGDSVKTEETVEGMQEDGHDHGHGHSHDEHDEEHDEAEGHDHGEEKDEHVWLSLKNAQVLCMTLADALCAIDPDNKNTYIANAAAYRDKLAALDADYQAAVDGAAHKTVLFGDRFPFRYLVDDYGLRYYAAFAGCSAETEASFETVSFLAKKVDELGLPCVLTIEGAQHRIAETIVQNTTGKNQKVLTMDSMQSTTSKDVTNGATYLSVMVGLMTTVPNNVHTMSPFIDGLVESSANLGVVSVDEDMVRFTVFARSSVAYQATQIGVICSALANSFGFTFDSEGHVPGWAVNPNSKLTHIACEAYKHLTGTDMIVEPVHAGVECGAFAEKNPHLDMISVGPTLLDVHTPNETCKIEDVKITTELLIEILERIAK